MYIKSTSFKPMSTHRNSLKLDILQLIRLCRQRSGDNTERIEDIINRSQKKIYRKPRDSEKIISESLKTEDYKNQLPKLTNRSIGKINRKQMRGGKERERGKERDSKQQESPKRKIVRSLQKYKLSTQKPQAVVLSIDKLSYAGSLPNHHFSKKKRIYTQIPSNAQSNIESNIQYNLSSNLSSNPQLRPLAHQQIPLLPLISPTINPTSTLPDPPNFDFLPAHQSNSIDYTTPSSLVHSTSRQLHKQLTNRLNKHKKHLNLMTNNGWKVEFNQYQTIYD